MSSYEWYEPLAKALAKDGMSMADIGSLFRISHNKVVLILSPGKKRRPLQEVYLEDWQNGMTASQIAKKHGVHAGTVHRALHRLRKRGRQVQSRPCGRKRKTEPQSGGR